MIHSHQPDTLFLFQVVLLDPFLRYIFCRMVTRYTALLIFAMFKLSQGWAKHYKSLRVSWWSFRWFSRQRAVTFFAQKDLSNRQNFSNALEPRSLKNGCLFMGCECISRTLCPSLAFLSPYMVQLNQSTKISRFGSQNVAVCEDTRRSLQCKFQRQRNFLYWWLWNNFKILICRHFVVPAVVIGKHDLLLPYWFTDVTWESDQRLGYSKLDIWECTPDLWLH